MTWESNRDAPYARTPSDRYRTHPAKSSSRRAATQDLDSGEKWEADGVRHGARNAFSIDKRGAVLDGEYSHGNKARRRSGHRSEIWAWPRAL